MSAISSTGVYAAFTSNIPVDVDDDERGDMLPDDFELRQNYPNPFNPNTTIRFSLPSRSQVKIEVFNLLGQSVRTLVKDQLSAGQHVVEWDGRDESGQEVASGVYLYRMSAGELELTRKMLLIR
ncbi:MAG: T9SS type A sorting domain-containing protein [bacterium]|nr:T9SS type A sorting domain-containing protein [bacterium]